MSFPVLDLLPHRPPMVLVESVQEVSPDEGTARCSCVFPVGSPVACSGSMPRMLVIEMLAQSAACLKGWIELLRGSPVRPAYLVRIDELRVGRTPAPGERIEVVARELRGVADYFIYEGRAMSGDREIASGVMRFVVDPGGR